MFEEEKEKHKKEIEDKLFFRWVYDSPFLEESIPFEEYKNKALKKPRLKSVTEEDNIELIERIERIRKQHQVEHP